MFVNSDLPTCLGITPIFVSIRPDLSDEAGEVEERGPALMVTTANHCPLRDRSRRFLLFRLGALVRHE
jgi:hypothetical protein